MSSSGCIKSRTQTSRLFIPDVPRRKLWGYSLLGRQSTPNPIGQTVVELVKRDKNTLWVRGLDALDDTPVLDVKPYPDWAYGRFKIVLDFKVPNWLRELIEE